MRPYLLSYALPSRRQRPAACLEIVCLPTDIGGIEHQVRVVDYGPVGVLPFFLFLLLLLLLLLIPSIDDPQPFQSQKFVDLLNRLRFTCDQPG